MKLTIGQDRALRVARDHPARESNVTDPDLGLIHWQPLNALLRKGLVEVVGHSNGRVVQITDTGRQALQ